MQQLDLFESSDPVFYLYGEMEKTKLSMSKQMRALFAIVTEIQSEVLRLKEEKESA